MGARQARHRARRSKYDSTGRLSYQAIGVLQCGQRERGRTIDSPWGSRATTTLRKEPMQAPTPAAQTRTSWCSELSPARPEASMRDPCAFHLEMRVPGVPVRRDLWGCRESGTATLPAGSKTPMTSAESKDDQKRHSSLHG